MTKHRLIVKPHRPGRVWAFRVLGVALVATAFVSIFHYGQYRAGFDRQQSQERILEMQAALRAARAETEELRDQLALSRHSSVVDRRARDTVQGSISEMQQEILDLRAELAFYRGIVSPEDAVAGLKIQNFSISRGPAERLFHYRLTLIQAINHDRALSGDVRMVLHGGQNGQPLQLSLADVSTTDREKLEYSFRYFQEFEGDLFLPEGFLPGRVEITLLPGGRERNAVTGSFEWVLAE